MRRALTLILFAVSLPLFADFTVTNVTPATGPTGGGTIVHLHGTNLSTTPQPSSCEPNDCLPYVMFGDRMGNITFESDNEIMVIAPAHEAGTVDLMVKLPLNQPLTLKDAFTFQDPANDTVRLLLPIAAGTQGEFGTSWQTDVLAHNETTSPVDIAGTTILPMATSRLALSPQSTGMFVQVPRSAIEGVTITTHVHDATHDADNLGVDVPTVPETQFRRAIVLTGVPNDPRYRVLLRVYGYPGENELIVRVRDDQTGKLLGGNFYPMSSSELTYLQLPISSPSSSRTLRVEVTGGFSTSPPIWGFITLTNNVTQSVTTITPNTGVAAEAPWQPFLQPGHYAHAGYCMTETEPLQGGTVTVNTGCGTAVIARVVDNVDTDGHFEGGGTFQPSGAPQPAEPAQVTGLVRFGTVAMTIRTPTRTIGPFTLIYNSTEPCATSCP